MDIFKNMFGFLMGNTNEISKPVFSKPYIDKTYDMLELARRLDKAPEESKPLFRGAMESMAAKIKAHQRINDLLSSSDLPILILYDLHIVCASGSASIDFVLLSNRFIATISCPFQEDTLTAQESRAISAPGEQHRQSSSEHSAYVLTELLKAEHLLSKKNLQMIWPLTVSAETPEQAIFSDPLESFPSSYSQTYPETHRNQMVKAEDFIQQIKQLFKVDEEFCWLTNKELFAISDMLLRYEDATKSPSIEQKG